VPSANLPLRRAIIAISLAPALAFGLGCGDSGSSTPGAGSVPRPASAIPVANTSRAAPPPKTAPSAHAQFVGFARVVNLRSQDVPGFAGKPKRREHFNLHNKAFEADSQYRRCFKVGKFPKSVFKASSDAFKAGSGLHLEFTHSEVEVAPTLATAQRELSTIRRMLGDPAVRGCLAGLFDQLGTQSQPIPYGKASVRVVVGDLKLAPLPLGSATAGTDGGFGLSLSMAITYVASYGERKLTVPTSLHLEVLAVLVGRGEVTLSTETLGEPFPPELEATLFSLLVSRAVAARQRYPALAR
jgi:hypothetical protein